MPTKFRFDREYGLLIEPGEQDELTPEHAMIAAVNNLARGMNLLADALSKFQAEFRLHSFVEPSAPSRRKPSKAAPKKPPRKKAAKKK